MTDRSPFPMTLPQLERDPAKLAEQHRKYEEHLEMMRIGELVFQKRQREVLRELRNDPTIDPDLVRDIDVLKGGRKTEPRSGSPSPHGASEREKTAAERIAEALGGSRSGDGYIARCPVHDDQRASLSISERGGKVLVRCRAHCSQGAVIEALRARGLWSSKGKKDVVATYDYVSEKGNLLYQVVRHEPKDFRQRRPDGKGGWFWNLQGVEPVPYRLPEVVEAVKVGAPIFVVEGEKDAETLRANGYVATCNSGGAGKWTAAHAKWMRGAEVLVVPDNDEPGRKHAEQVRKSLIGIAAVVKIVELPSPVKDSSDFFAARGAKERFDALVATAQKQPARHASRGRAEIDGAALLDDVRTFISRFVAFPDESNLDAVTLWAAHTHMVECFHTTPRLAAVSAEPESGKTRLLEILDLLTPNPMLILSPSVAAVFRKLANEQVTLLIDECDTIFNFRGKDDQNEDLRALLNAGYRRGAHIPRCTGKNHEVQEFAVFAATALAGIGDLPETVMTRAIVIRMKRRTSSETVEPFRLRIHEEQGHALRDRLALWAESVGAEAGAAYPDLPEGVVDRRAEAWEPLISIADLAGRDWARRSRVSAVLDVLAHRNREGSLGIRLLADLRTVFGDREGMWTKDILAALHSMEEAPWGDLRGKPLDARGLAVRVRKYGVKPKTVRFGNDTSMGYVREDLHDAWERYLSHPLEANTPNTPNTSATESAAASAEVMKEMG